MGFYLSVSFSGLPYHYSTATQTFARDRNFQDHLSSTSRCQAWMPWPILDTRNCSFRWLVYDSILVCIIVYIYVYIPPFMKTNQSKGIW